MQLGKMWGRQDYLTDFQEIPEVNAVINLEARAFSAGHLKVVNEKGETQEKDPVHLRLQRPNWFQDQKEFMRQSRLNRNIYGNQYEYRLIPVGMPDKIKGLFTLPPDLIKQKFTDSKAVWWLEESPSIETTIEVNGTDRRIPTEDVMHSNDNRIIADSHKLDDILKGMSKLHPLSPNRTNLRYAYESRGIVLKYRGAQGILSNNQKDVGGGISIDPAEKQRIQDEYRNYGGLEGQFSIIITDADLRWQQMNIAPDRLGLFEETEADFFKVQDAYGVPAELFGRKNGSTYENQKQARKGLYTEGIIPSANEWAAGLNSFLMPEGSKNRIVVDYTHLSIFQEDLKERAGTVSIMVNALSRMLQDQAITIDEYKAELARYGLTAKK